MELEFLGTGAGVPAKSRNVTSIALKLLDELNEVWLFDVGEATQHQILSTTIKPRKITKIFLTHLHGDHLFGLPGLLSSRSFQGGDGPLTIYGPPKVEKFVKTALAVSDTHLGYKINYVPVTESGLVFEDHGFKVTCEKLEHRVPSFGYRVEEKPRAGELLVDKLKAYHIKSGPIYGKLKRGEEVTLEDGTVLDGKDFVGPDHPGRVVSIFGDTRKTPQSVVLAQDADVMVHESTFGKAEGKLAYDYYHSTNIQAANIAKQASAKRLLLTHISARYNGNYSYELEKEAKKVFKNTKVVKDFDIIDVPMKR